MTELARAEGDVTALGELLSRGEAVVLTGAGVSTESGIPAYRDEDGRWQQSPPMQFRDFTGSLLSRQRYWARSMVGWERMAKAQPNRAHHALAEMEERRLLRLLITQNVDGLHSASVNRGKTRADDLAVLRLAGDVGELLGGALRAAFGGTARA